MHRESLASKSSQADQIATALGYLIAGFYEDTAALIQEHPSVLDQELRVPHPIRPLLVGLIETDALEAFVWVLDRTPSEFIKPADSHEWGFTRIVKTAVEAGIKWVKPLHERFGSDIFRCPMTLGDFPSMMSCAIQAGQVDVVHFMADADPSLLVTPAMGALMPLEACRHIVDQGALEWPWRVPQWRQVESLLLAMDAKAAASDALCGAPSNAVAMRERHEKNTRSH